MSLPAEDLFAEIVCECRACGLKFQSVVVFDKHRVGAYDLAAPGFGRHCLTTDGLRAAGMSPDSRGCWRTSFWGEKTPMNPPPVLPQDEESPDPLLSTPPGLYRSAKGQIGASEADPA